MSLPWNKTVHLRVSPDEVRATLAIGWPRAATAAEARREIEASDPGASASDGVGTPDAGGHAQHIDAVLQEIDSQSPLKGGRLHVELASALLHLDVADGDFAGRTDRQLLDIATACVAEILGDTAGDHEIRWHLQRGGRHLLIAAIDSSLLAMLSEAAQAWGMRLASVQPEFVTQWNAHGHAVKPGQCVFAVSATRDLAIAAVVDGAISSVSIGPPIDIDASDEEPSTPVVERLYAKTLTGLRVTGLASTSHGVFSPSRLQPLSGTDALDVRVDRMLVASGRDPAEQSVFVLVAPDAPSIAPSPRWSTLGLRSAQA